LIDAEFRGDNGLIAYRSQRLTDEKLIMPAAIAFRRIKVGAAELNGIADQSNGFFPIRGRSVTVVEAHASHANRRDFDIPEQTRLHVYLPSEIVEFSLDGVVVGAREGTGVTSTGSPSPHPYLRLAISATRSHSLRSLWRSRTRAVAST